MNAAPAGAVYCAVEVYVRTVLRSIHVNENVKGAGSMEGEGGGGECRRGMQGSVSADVRGRVNRACVSPSAMRRRESEDGRGS